MARSKFSEKDLEIIKSEYLNGKSINQIAKEFGTYFNTISNYLKSIGIFQYKDNRWTDKEIKYLKDNYSSANWDELLQVLYPKSKEAIIHKAYNLKIKREIYFWSENDVAILIDAYNNKLSVSKIRELLNNKFSEDAILTKANKLGIYQKQWWSQNEDNLLKEKYHIYDMDEICKLFPNRTKDAIITHAQKLKLVHKSIWTREETQFLIDNHRKMCDEEIANILHKTKDGVRGKRFVEKLYHPVSPGTYNYISEYIRKRNKDWKFKSMKKYNYKCAITGEKFQAIHHLYGMNLILEETLDELNYPKDIDIKDLTQNDLDKIVKHYYIVQNRYPDGVCLTDEIHKQFHNEYGYGNNTPEQFEEFLSKHDYKIA